jgi:DNA-binding XRE family transcriptional regulator
MPKKKAADRTTDQVAPSSPGPVDAFPGGMGRTVSGELNYLVRHLMEKGRDAVQLNPGDWPRATLTGESVSAEVVFTPQAQNPQAVIPDDQADQYRLRMWGLLQSLDDLTADVWDALVCQWVAGAMSPDSKVWVSVDDILAYRGLSSHLTGGRRGGFTAEQRQAVTEALLRIIAMRLQVFSMTVMEEQDDGHGNLRMLPVQRQIGGPALEVGMDLSQTNFLGQTEIRALLIRPGEMFARYFAGAGRPIALLSQKALTYRPRTEDWEKRLTRYFAYSWDRRGGDEVRRQRHTIAQLLEAAHHQPHPSRPDETKDRLERALQRLTDDKVIAGWQYVPGTWDEAGRPSRHWVPPWLQASIEIEAPEEVQQFYALALPETAATLALAPSLPPQIVEGQLTGEAIAVLRKHFGLSQEAFASEVGVTRPLITLVEGGRRPVSKKLQESIRAWLTRRTAD